MNLENMLSEKNQTPKVISFMIPFTEISSIGKSIETGGRLVVVRAWGEQECRVTAKG